MKNSALNLRYAVWYDTFLRRERREGSVNYLIVLSSVRSYCIFAEITKYRRFQNNAMELDLDKVRSRPVLDWLTGPCRTRPWFKTMVFGLFTVRSEVIFVITYMVWSRGLARPCWTGSDHISFDNVLRVISCHRFSAWLLVLPGRRAPSPSTLPQAPADTVFNSIFQYLELNTVRTCCL